MIHWILYTQPHRAVWLQWILDGSRWKAQRENDTFSRLLIRWPYENWWIRAQRCRNRNWWLKRRLNMSAYWVMRGTLRVKASIDWEINCAEPSHYMANRWESRWRAQDAGSGCWLIDESRSRFERKIGKTKMELLLVFLAKNWQRRKSGGLIRSGFRKSWH